MAVLRALGLQSSITPHLFLQSARRVHRAFLQARGQGDENAEARAFAAATDLTAHLLSHFSSLAAAARPAPGPGPGPVPAGDGGFAAVWLFFFFVLFSPLHPSSTV